MPIFRSHWNYRIWGDAVLWSHTHMTYLLGQWGLPQRHNHQPSSGGHGCSLGAGQESFLQLLNTFMGDKAGGRRISLWDTVLWDSACWAHNCVLEIHIVSCLNKVLELMTTVKKSSAFPWMYKTVQFKYKLRSVFWLWLLFYYLWWIERHY